MSDALFDRMLQAARRGSLSRRQVLERGLKLGMSTAAITTLMAAAPEVGASPRPASLRSLSRAQGQATGTFTIIGDESSPDLDPHSAYSNSAARILVGTHETLIMLKGESTTEFDPVLAESWEASADNSTFTFKIPAGVTFQDGDPCTAESVRASFQRFLEMGMGPVNVISRFMPDASMMEVVDDQTITFNLGKPQPLFLSAMASAYGPFVVNTKYVEENKTDDDPWAHEFYLNGAPGSGTGPYMLTENEVTQQVTIEKFEGFHGGWDGPHFDKVVMRVVGEIATRRQLVENGEGDALDQSLTPEDYEAMKTNPDLQVLSNPSTAVFWTIMNTPRLKSPGVKQGFSYAFPYDEIKDGVYKGLMTRSGPIATAVRGHDPDVFIYQTDLAKAKELILAGGFAEGDTFEYTLASEEATERSIAELFQANIAEMGFALTIKELDSASYNDMMYGDSPAEERPHFMGGWFWWPDYNDAWNQLYPNFAKASAGSAGSNAGYYSNDRLEEILAATEHFTDEAEYNTLMKEAQNILTEQDPPVLYYGEALWTTVLRKDIVGFEWNPLYMSQYPLHKMYRQS
jgi:peptide/nickel transport system substrate-binding protein